MDGQSLKKWVVALLIGGSITVTLHLLVSSGPGLIALNALVYVTAIRLLITVPDLLKGPPTRTFDSQTGYGAALLAVILVGVHEVVQMGDTSPTGIAVLVFGVGIAMWTYGVWFERVQKHSVD